MRSKVLLIIPADGNELLKLQYANEVGDAPCLEDVGDSSICSVKLKMS